jgi:hypothetical protein
MEVRYCPSFNNPEDFIVMREHSVNTWREIDFVRGFNGWDITSKSLAF